VEGPDRLDPRRRVSGETVPHPGDLVVPGREVTPVVPGIVEADFSIVSVSKARNAGMGSAKFLRMTASKPVRTVTWSAASSIVSNDRTCGSMLGVVTIQSRS
jgi:hypothetical protein